MSEASGLARLVIGVLCVAFLAVALVTGGGRPRPWTGDTVLSLAERREFEQRRAAIEVRAEEVARALGVCRDLSARLRNSLLEVRQVRSVDVTPILLTSHPPKMTVTFEIVLGSGRVVSDRLAVTVPVRPRLVPLGEPAPDATASSCDPGAP